MVEEEGREESDVSAEVEVHRLEPAIFDALPPHLRTALRKAHQLGILVAADDEIYEGLPKPRRR